jgi:hypothetical protein
MAANWNDPRVRTLYSNAVLETLQASHVWALGFNKNYVGEVRGKGSAVRIFSFPRPQTNAYNVDGDLTGPEITYQRLHATSQELVVDTDRDFAIATDKLQEMLVSPDTFDELRKQGAWALADDEDRDLAMRLQEGAGTVDPLGNAAANVVGFGATSTITAFAVMERLEEELKNRNVPTTDVHLFVPHWFYTMIALDDRFSSFGTDANRRTARGDRITELANITIHETSNSLNGAGTGFSTGPDGSSQNRIIAVWRGAATFVPWDNIPVDFISASSNVLSRDDLLRAWRVWGAKVLIADGVVSQIVQRGEYEPA